MQYEKVAPSDLITYLRECKEQGYKVVGLEQTGSSKPLFSTFSDDDPDERGDRPLRGEESEYGPVSIGNELHDPTKALKAETVRFPTRCVLVLGKEKEGIPVDILQEVDECIEIPQFGITRSLNVHVSAALAIWEMTKQNIDFLTQYSNLKYDKESYS
jgi:hypothetical protein